MAEAQAERNTLLDLYRSQTDELMERNRWAERLGAELESLGQVLINERKHAEALASEYDTRVTQLEVDNLVKTEWALATAASLEERSHELVRCLELLQAAETTVEERTLWAQRTEKLRTDLAAQLDLIRQSRWIRLGRKFRLGPSL